MNDEDWQKINPEGYQKFLEENGTNLRVTKFYLIKHLRRYGNISFRDPINKEIIWDFEMVNDKKCVLINSIKYPSEFAAWQAYEDVLFNAFIRK